jgi:para-aminobenzoate synthetase/4-amino-4-deoxychorismate lyase
VAIGVPIVIGGREVTVRPDPQRGVFETMLVVDGRPVELESHLGRLRASLEELYGTAPPAGTSELVHRHAAGLELGRLRLTVAPATEPEVRVAPLAPEMVFPGWDGAPLLRPLPLPGGLGAHKWADRRRVEPSEHEPGVVPLLLDADGSVLEASRGNVFLVAGGMLVTPPADGRILPGVTRRRVLALARATEVPVRERQVGYSELLAADEVFLTGAVRGVEPVRGCAGGTRWDEGPVTRGLARQLRRLWTAVPAKEGSAWQ